MKYVIDSSVAFKWVVSEAHDGKARQLRAELRGALHDLLAPDVFPIELGHSLTRAERQGRVSTADGWSFWLSILGDNVQLHPSIPLMPRAYAISSRMRIGIYDCLYVALAEREGCEFITADDRLERNLQTHFPFIVALASLP
ncbi:MAG: type II toxin-antitoxin system VapC family toxin [Planctomycetia bacterium]|nr:type II toxin-antitoxin system VapC family toxin [Planctomycetia bacterium]